MVEYTKTCTWPRFPGSIPWNSMDIFRKSTAKAGFYPSTVLDIRIPITPVDDECSITTGFLCVCPCKCYIPTRHRRMWISFWRHHIQAPFLKQSSWDLPPRIPVVKGLGCLRGAKPGPNPLKVRMMIEVLYILAGEVFFANFGAFIFDW